MASIFLVFKWPGFPVFKLHSNTGPFGICHLFDHSNIKLVLYSDFKAIYNKNISLATLFGRLDGNLIFVLVSHVCLMIICGKVMCIGLLSLMSNIRIYVQQ